MILSRFFENTGRAEIGLKLVTFSASPDLNKGKTFAIFKNIRKSALLKRSLRN